MARSDLMLSLIVISGGSTGDTLPVSLYLSLAVSLTALVALVVLLVNCVTCCKEREINFKVRILAGGRSHPARVDLMNTEWSSGREIAESNVIVSGF